MIKKFFLSVILSLSSLVSQGCFQYGGGYYRSYPVYQRYNQPPVYEDAERRAWLENAQASPLIFEDAARVRRHILEETKEADFNNPEERRAAQIRALQIKERAWNEQVRRWNAELEARGYRRVYSRK